MRAGRAFGARRLDDRVQQRRGRSDGDRCPTSAASLGEGAGAERRPAARAACPAGISWPDRCRGRRSARRALRRSVAPESSISHTLVIGGSLARRALALPALVVGVGVFGLARTTRGRRSAVRRRLVGRGVCGAVGAARSATVCCRAGAARRRDAVVAGRGRLGRWSAPHGERGEQRGQPLRDLLGAAASDGSGAPGPIAAPTAMPSGEHAGGQQRATRGPRAGAARSRPVRRRRARGRERRAAGGGGVGGVWSIARLRRARLVESRRGQRSAQTSLSGSNLSGLWYVRDSSLSHTVNRLRNGVPSMNRIRRLSVALAVAGVLGVAAPAAASALTTITISGATASYPLVSLLAQKYVKLTRTKSSSRSLRVAPRSASTTSPPGA